MSLRSCKQQSRFNASLWGLSFALLCRSRALILWTLNMLQQVSKHLKLCNTLCVYLCAWGGWIDFSATYNDSRLKLAQLLQQGFSVLVLLLF